jgi:hypothetical protein
MEVRIMADVMRDIQILLYKAKENGNQSLGEDEIFPVAFLVKEETQHYLFNGAHFYFGYSGITSHEIRGALKLIRKNISVRIKDRPVPDFYFEITQIGEEKTKKLIGQIDNCEWEEKIEKILKELGEDRYGTIQKAIRKLHDL